MGIQIADIAIEQRQSILALFGEDLVDVDANGTVEFIWADAKECLDEFDRAIDTALWRGKRSWCHLAETALLNGTRQKITDQVDWAAEEARTETCYLTQGIEL